MSKKKLLNGESIEIDIPEYELHYIRPSNKFFGKVINSSSTAGFLRTIIGQPNIGVQESFVVMYLNRANNVIGFYKHTKGSIVGVTVDSRLIMSIALKSLATSIIICHNHPSGQLKVSQLDYNITKLLEKAAGYFDILVTDHIILTTDSYYSLADNNEMEWTKDEKLKNQLNGYGDSDSRINPERLTELKKMAQTLNLLHK